MSDSDAVMWTIERDPCLRSTIVAVMMLDRSPDWGALVRRFEEAAMLIPRLRQRVVEMPLRLAPPRWELDEFFDLGFHLRRAVAPAPGDTRAVLEIAEHMAMTAFDKDRPLWEFTLVEGLAGGRAAFIQKVHHSVTDGVGGIALARLLLDGRRTPVRRRAPASATGQPPRSTMFMSLAETLTGDVRTAARTSIHGMQAFPAIATRAVTSPGRSATTLAHQLRSVGKLLAPVTKPSSPVMTERGLSRHFDAFDIPLDDLLGAAHAADSSLNDAFLAAVAGGMRVYHERHGMPVASLRVTMPINIRRPGDAAGSNRFTPARFTLPIATADPAERMSELGRLARSWRNEPSLGLTDVIAGALNRMPPAAATAALGSMLKAIDFVATNVPGLQQRVYLAGAAVERQYAFAPASGSAFSVALVSHGDQCCLGVNADTSAVPDHELLGTCLRDGFDEVLALGRKSSCTR
jgi:WS/DGAT/MGAT family acyltransferase